LLREVAILNPRLLALLAGAGHTDLIVIADAGLPIPSGLEVIDLSLVSGVPSFIQVLDAIRKVLAVESAVMARETRGQAVYGELVPRLKGLSVEEVSHEEFKARLSKARGVIRTGETTPYANLGLVAGVTF
jgi:D-ribose pyranase